MPSSGLDLAVTISLAYIEDVPREDSQHLFVGPFAAFPGSGATPVERFGDAIRAEPSLSQPEYLSDDLGLVLVDFECL